MIDSSTLTFKHYVDNRVKTHPGFIEGLSGPLKIATSKSGRKYIVKHACFHNAANELVGSWLGYKIGAPVPHAYLLKPSEKFPSMYGVAIEFIEDLRPLDAEHMTEQMKADVCAQFALNMLIDTDDSLQLSTADGRVYSMDFAEAFYVSDTMMLMGYLRSEVFGAAFMNSKLDAFCDHVGGMTFDIACEFAPELNLDPDTMKAGMIAAAKKVLEIPGEEIVALKSELMEMYPAGYADYYQSCIYAIQAKAELL